MSKRSHHRTEHFRWYVMLALIRKFSVLRKYQRLFRADFLLRTSPNNPVPIYDITTTFDKPTVPVNLSLGNPDLPLSVISIDILPSLLPRESSEMFSQALLPSLLQLNNRSNARVWTQAEDLFKQHVATLPKNPRA
jgi:hypothetical protein